MAASGEFTTVPYSFIYVDRANRQRRELTDIEALAESISKIGLLHPVVIERDGQLRAGERRYTAIGLLGWTAIPVQWIDEVDESTAVLIELEENIRRQNISWEEECLAVKRYHETLKALNPEHSSDDTGDALGVNRSVVNKKIRVAEALLEGNARVIAAPKFSTALNIVTRMNERKAEAAVAAVAKTTEPEAAAAPRVVPLFNEDFHEWAPAYTGPLFNFVHCDFPYGVNADKHDQGQAAVAGGYEDSFETYVKCLDTLGVAMEGVVAPNAHLMFWFSMDYYQYTFDRLTRMGWNVNPFPLIWYKDDNTGILPDPNRGPRRIYETAFFASRGDRKVVQAVANAKAWPGRDKSIHMSEKPVGMLTHFFRMIVDDTTRMLDPTAGSANSLKAATALGAPTVVGLERDTEFFERARDAYFKSDDLGLDLG